MKFCPECSTPESFLPSLQQAKLMPSPPPSAATDLSGQPQELGSRAKSVLLEKYLSLATHSCPHASWNIPAPRCFPKGAIWGFWGRCAFVRM